MRERLTIDRSASHPLIHSGLIQNVGPAPMRSALWGASDLSRALYVQDTSCCLFSYLSDAGKGTSICFIHMHGASTLDRQLGSKIFRTSDLDE